MFSGDWYILGAKSIAIGVIRALRMCNHECNILGVIVSSKETNPEYVEGYKVEELSVLSRRLDDKTKAETNVLIATSIYLSGEIKGTLKNFGFLNVFELDSVTETKLMSEYYRAMGVFDSVKDLAERVSLKNDSENDSKALVMPSVTVLEVRHHLDQPLRHKCDNPEWVYGFQAGIPDGKGLTSVNGSISKYADNSGDNIADKNPAYRELTAFYWAWKNISGNENEYVGVSRYKRFLDLEAEDLAACKHTGVDVILSYPMVHLPNVIDYHKRYTSEEEWDALITALNEKAPDYIKDSNRIWGSQYMYKFNMMISTKEVFDEYCEWLFPILFRAEEIIKEKNIIQSRRNIAYFGECLMTLYFMHNAYKYNIKHTGRILRI